MSHSVWEYLDPTQSGVSDPAFLLLRLISLQKQHLYRDINTDVSHKSSVFETVCH